jgi:hypothetical protein
MARDVDGARRVLVPEGHFFAVDMRTPKTRTQLLENEEYFKALQQGKSIRRERMWSPEVRVHGAIATVWTPYDFWMDGKFSHCGIDAFDLIKGDDGWKIAGGVFTTEVKCEPSPLGPLGK